MAYSYIKRAYGIEPIIGQPVRMKNYPPGVVAPEDSGQAHYVMVRFEGWDHDAPVHPNDLEYLPMPSGDPAAAARASFDEDHSVGARRRGRDGRSISHSYGAEGRNWAGE